MTGGRKGVTSVDLDVFRDHIDGCIRILARPITGQSQFHNFRGQSVLKRQLAFQVDERGQHDVRGYIAVQSGP